MAPTFGFSREPMIARIRAMALSGLLQKNSQSSITNLEYLLLRLAAVGPSVEPWVLTTSLGTSLVAAQAPLDAEKANRAT